MGMSRRAYARYRECSDYTVRKAIEKGYIPLEEDGTIDPKKADVQWDSLTDPAQMQRKPASSVQDQKRSAACDEIDPNITNPNDYALFRAQHEAYKARLAKIEYEQKRGKLADVEEVKEYLFYISRMTRDQMQGIPDRIHTILAAEKDAFEVHRILRQEIDNALHALCDEAEKAEKGGKLKFEQ